MADDRISDWLQEYLKANDLYQLTAVEANRLLAIAGLLPDSTDRPGLPLRKRCREGRVRGAVQEPNGRWFVRRLSVQPQSASQATMPRASAVPKGGTTLAAAGDGVLPDVLDHGLAVVFVGESAGEVSAREGAYFARRGNTFWSQLAAAAITDRELRPDEFRRLPEYGVGLTDVFKHVTHRQLRMMTSEQRAATLRTEVPNLVHRITIGCPTAVCFMGVKLGREVGQFLFGWDEGETRDAGCQSDARIGDSQIWLCPSTSPAARSYAASVASVLRSLKERVITPWNRR
jgi:TDG/mug DNA glycosylase family protein